MKMRVKRVMPIWLGIIIFLFAFLLGALSKMVIKPSWSKKYQVNWSEEIGIVKKDLVYGKGEYNKFDLYLPSDKSKKSYGLVVYLHAGGFTAGDKADDKSTLE